MDSDSDNLQNIKLTLKTELEEQVKSLSFQVATLEAELKQRREKERELLKVILRSIFYAVLRYLCDYSKIC